MRISFSILICLLIAAAIFGYQLWTSYTLQQHGQLETCVVAHKYEYISIRRGNWSRRFDLELNCPWKGPSAPTIPQFQVSESKYDGYRVNDRVQIRYLPSSIPAMFVGAQRVRLADDTAVLRTSIPELAAWTVGIILLFITAFYRKAAWLFFGYLLLLASYYSGANQLLLPEGKQNTATATITQVHSIKTFGDSSSRKAIDLIQPYAIVGLQFTPAGAMEPVIGVDEIDTDSIPNLNVKSPVKISYEVTHPRIVAIVGARRSFQWKNTLAIGLFFGAVLAVVGWLAWRAAARKRAANF